MFTTLIETYKKIVTLGRKICKKKVSIKFFIKQYTKISLFWEFISINYPSTNQNSNKLIATLDNKKILLFYEFKSESFYFAGWSGVIFPSIVGVINKFNLYNLLFCYY